MRDLADAEPVLELRATQAMQWPQPRRAAPSPPIRRLRHRRLSGLRGRARRCRRPSRWGRRSVRRLTELPPEIGHLHRLTTLDLGHFDLRSNRLTLLPDWVPAMPSLEELDLRWNDCDPPPALLTELERRGVVVLR
ncbi:hypothetical protein [Streptomyces sp. NBC_00986]|uniref:hypothetical protein n=1 Tax=Streptomyces sp. NBC_00986 TaxID=2903702 RepID=UPI003864D204